MTNAELCRDLGYMCYCHGLDESSQYECLYCQAKSAIEALEKERDELHEYAKHGDDSHDSAVEELKQVYTRVAELEKERDALRSNECVQCGKLDNTVSLPVCRECLDEWMVERFHPEIGDFWRELEDAKARVAELEKALEDAEGVIGRIADGAEIPGGPRASAIGYRLRHLSRFPALREGGDDE